MIKFKKCFKEVTGFVFGHQKAVKYTSNYVQCVQLEINKTMCADSISKSNNDSLIPEKSINSDTLKSGSSIEKSQP